MSAPTPAPGDESPREGYYPDPSIPGYVRYWNGASWVPGTSRPAPRQDEPMPAPPPAGRQYQPPQPNSPVPSASSTSSTSSAPSSPSTPSNASNRSNSSNPVAASVPAAVPADLPIDETGPVFLDEEPQPDNRPEPATAWQADASRQAGFGGEHGRWVSWGAAPQPGGQADPALPSGPGPEAGAGTGPGAVAGRGPGMPPGPVPADRTPTDGATADRGPHDGAPAVRAASAAVVAEPRRSTPQAPADGALPGRRGSGDAQAAENTVTLRAVGRGERPPAVGTSGPPPEEGTMAIRALSPGAGASGPVPQTPSAGRGPVPAQGPVSVPAAPVPVPVPASPNPVPAQSPVPPVDSGAGAASWGQQARRNTQPAPVAPQQPQQSQAPQLQQSQPQQYQPQPQAQPRQSRLPLQAQEPHPQLGMAGGQQPDQPVTPWKPPVDDLFQQLAQAQMSGRPAGLGKRFVARLVDTVVLGALVGAIGFPLVTRALDHIDAKIDAAKMSGRTVTVWLVDPTTAGLFGAVLGAFLVLGVLLEALPTAKWGRTLGKKLCGLDVRGIESHEPPSFGAALRRWLVYGVLGVLVVGVVNVLWCLFDRPWRQCWHDKAAHTFVAG
ncbi:RDD family protein [Streptomyces sp. NPDC052042]|uniref:RDD family protein n=1 Tax=Streptomyces sp. NPDC052042 TaxID=3365683 RepID=UPI0037D048FB